MDNSECLILIRGQKPLKVMKIIPDELSAFNELKRIKITEYIPKWRYDEENGKCNTDSIPYENDFEDIDDIEENPFSDFDISKAEIIGASVISDTNKDEDSGLGDDTEFKVTPMTPQNIVDKFKNKREK